MDFIISLLICLALTHILSWLFRKLGLPHILGHLATGLLISIPLISDYLLGDPSAEPIFGSLADLGLIFLLFFIGLKINIHKLIEFSKKSLSVAFLSALIPFILGFVFGRYLGLDNLAAVILGACLSITAEAVSAAVLEELNMLNTYIGAIIIEAGIIDDLFEVLILATIGSFIQQGSTFGGISSIVGFESIFVEIFLFIIIIYLVRFLIIPYTFKMLDKSPTHYELFTASFIVVLLMAVVANYLELGVVIGALIAGIIVKQTLVKEHKIEEKNEVVDIIETVTFGLLEPVFFIWIAYKADIFHLMIGNPLEFMMVAGVITVIATAGKLLGSIIGNLLEGGTLKEGILIGWGMNARGAVELIAVKLAFEYQLVNNTIYSSIVLMTFITTIVSPILFKIIAKNFKKLEMDQD